MAGTWWNREKDKVKSHHQEIPTRNGDSSRVFELTPNTPQTPNQQFMFRNSFHLGLCGCLGYPPGVCCGSLRLDKSFGLDCFATHPLLDRLLVQSLCWHKHLSWNQRDLEIRPRCWMFSRVKTTTVGGYQEFSGGRTIRDVATSMLSSNQNFGYYNRPLKELKLGCNSFS